MSFFVSAFIVASLSLGVCVGFRKKFAYTLPASLAAISLVLYIAAFANLRTAAVWLIVLLSILSLFYLIYIATSNWGRLHEAIGSSSLIFFIVVILFVLYLSKGYVYTTWDEFSHWGTIVKNLSFSQDFGNSDGTTTLFRWYPVGASLFLSFTAGFSKVFSESSTLAGMLLLSYSQLAILFTKMSWREYRKYTPVLIAALAAPVVLFYNFYDVIYVDALLGLIFANIVIFEYAYPRKDVFYSVYQSLQFYLLTNTKQIGIVLVAIASCIIFVRLLWVHRAVLQNRLKAWVFSHKNNLAAIFTPIFVALATYLSWKSVVTSHQITENFASPSLWELLGLLGPSRPTYTLATFENFVRYFFEVRPYGILSASLFLLSVIFMLVLYSAYRSRKKTQGALLSISLGIGLLGYSLVIFIMYLTSFDEYEATHVASIERYLGTYLLAMLVVTLYCVTNVVLIRKHKDSTLHLALIALAVVSIAPTAGLINYTLLKKPTQIVKNATRQQYAKAADYQRLLNSRKDKVFVVSQDSNGEDYYTLRYIFTPIPTQEVKLPNNHIFWSLGEPYNKDDQWSANLSAPEWLNILQAHHFTYVYLFDIDERFAKDYAEVFDLNSEIVDGGMYRVETLGGRPLLVYDRGLSRP